MELMITLGWIGGMLLIGMALRGVIPFLRKSLVPSSVLAGVIGFIFVNTTGLIGSNPALLTDVVSQLFTISFISIGLTGQDGGAKNGNSKNILKGSVAMGFVWVILYALTPVVGALSVMAFGGFTDMNPMYGLLIPFAFAQGPGQAASFGAVFESYGWQNAAMVGVTFAAIGFLFAFLVGVPLAKAGLRRGLAKNGGILDQTTIRGVYLPNEQKPKSGFHTTHSGNIDPLAFHMALVGGTYVLTYLDTVVLTTLLGAAGNMLWGMMFMTGMFCAYFVKFVMRKLGIAYLHDNETQKRITGFATDFLVAASFMAVQITVIGRWIAPIMAVCIATGIVTYVLCIYFGKRFGGSNDFERTLGLWGMATGTVPSGIGLVRIVDPDLATTTAVELGAMNIPMMLSAPTMITLPLIADGTLSMSMGLLLLLAPIPVFLILLKVFRLWGKKTYSFSKGKQAVSTKDGD